MFLRSQYLGLANAFSEVPDRILPSFLCSVAQSSPAEHSLRFTDIAVFILNQYYSCALCPKMAEGFAVFGAITGVIGLCLTVRNGIETIYQDIHTFRNVRSDSQEKVQILDCQRHRLIDWQDQWMCWHEDGQSLLHHHLWGDRCRLIHDLLLSIRRYLEFLREVLAKTSRSRRSKFSYTFVKKRLVVINLGHLESMITGLETQANSAYTREHNDTISSGLINWIGEGFQLVSLAKQTHMSSEDLYTACRGSSAEVVLDLGLNFFHEDYDFQGVGPDWGAEKQRSRARLRAIFASAKESTLHFTFLGTEKRPSDPLIRTHIRNDTSLAEQEYQRSFPRAFRQIFSKEKGEIGFDTPGNDRAHRFVIRDASYNGTNPMQPWAFKNLRKVLSMPHQYDGNTPQNFIYLTKLKAVLELIDCGLLFIRTSWFSQLCSCALHRQGAELGERIHIFRVTEFEHVTPTCDDIEATHCWCMQDPVQGMYIRRLGILLVELALETPVFDVTLAANSTDLELSFLSEPAFLYGRLSRRESWNNTKARLKQAGVDEAYIKVVKYCLECTWTRDRVLISEDLLREYYWKILQP